MQRIEVAVAEFGPEHRERITQAVARWASVHFAERRDQATNVPPDRECSIVVGWPDPNRLASGVIRLAQIGSAGLDAYEGYGLADAAVRICSARGVYSPAAAEHAVAMMLAFVRELPQHWAVAREKRFERRTSAGEAAGSTACIVGFGSIGAEVRRLCSALDMSIVVVSDHDTGALPPAVSRVARSQMQEALAGTDHLFVTASGVRENRRLIGEGEISALPEGAFLYNVARGHLVDESALVDALNTGRLAGAGIDVTDPEPLPSTSPLWTAPNCMITGHSAGWSRRFADRFCDLVIENLSRFHDGRELINETLVN